MIHIFKNKGDVQSCSNYRAGLEFDGGTAAICRRAVPTGRNAL